MQKFEKILRGVDAKKVEHFRVGVTIKSTGNPEGQLEIAQLNMKKKIYKHKMLIVTNQI